MAAGLACGAAPASMLETIKDFSLSKHRWRFVAEVDCVRFYNGFQSDERGCHSEALEAFSEDR